jgi:uncharacterized protein YukE
VPYQRFRHPHTVKVKATTEKEVARMAGTGYGFTQSQMKQAADGYEQAAAGARQTMSLLESEIQAATQNKMAGKHKVSMDRLHVQIQDDMTTINKALDEMSQRVASTLAKYNSNDQQGSDLYTRLLGRTN